MRVVSVSPMSLDLVEQKSRCAKPPKKSNLPSLAISLFVIQAPRLQTYSASLAGQVVCLVFASHYTRSS